MKLSNRVAIITGASSGIGRAIALLFAEEGARIVVVDKDPRGEEVTGLIKEKGGDAIFLKCDVRSNSDIQNLVQKAPKVYGQIDILVNNAGIYKRAGVEKTTEEDWIEILDVNLKGPFLFSKYAIPFLKKSKKGTIINLASDLGISPEPDSPAYCASKAALIALTKSMAKAYARDNVRVNAICPGPIDTPLLRNAFTSRQELEEYIHETAIGRLGRPEEVAKVALFLASDDASYVNGAAYSVNAADIV